tara:strand:+ start:231 stop:692 length:462 start_codon:yes stop_codon:yes gene_type:complete
MEDTLDVKMKLEWIDRLIIIYVGIGLYMIAVYAFTPTCRITTGFFIWVMIIIGSTRTVKIVTPFDVGLEIIMIGWGIYELSDLSCYTNKIVMWYLIINMVLCGISLVYFTRQVINNRIRERVTDRLEQNDFYEEGLLDREMNTIIDSSESTEL